LNNNKGAKIRTGRDFSNGQNAEIQVLPQIEDPGERSNIGRIFKCTCGSKDCSREPNVTGLKVRASRNVREGCVVALALGVSFVAYKANALASFISKPRVLGASFANVEVWIYSADDAFLL
jgi:hypothetical protein